MKRTDLLKSLQGTAKGKGHKLLVVREGGNHTIYCIGTWEFPVPRHREINELTAQGILKRAEKEPGKT